MIANYTDTIVACATPHGVAGIAVIRCSGEQALSIALNLVKKKTLQPKQVEVCAIYDPSTQCRVDVGCVIYFKGPKSFTGQDCIEFHCHSSSYIVKTILSLCVQLGARLALPGEFSKRACINGKLSLTQAESIIDLIHAETRLQHTVSLNRVEGKLYKHILGFREHYIHILQQVEASIDFPDEVEGIDRTDVIKQCERLDQQLAHIVQIQDFGKIIQQGIHCVVLGRPNVGKSSLFNSLLEEDRSIVTNIAGTTRDYIKETIEYNDIQLIMYDTAGLHESTDTVEYLGMEKVQALMDKADLILWVCDGSEPWSEQDQHISDLIAKKNNIGLLVNKKDLPTKFESQHKGDLVFLHHCSTRQIDTINTLKSLIYNFKTESINQDDLEYLCNIRQESCLKKLYNENKQLVASLKLKIPDDILAVELRKCIDWCSELTGDALTEELLDGIFSRFCVGK